MKKIILFLIICFGFIHLAVAQEINKIEGSVAKLTSEPLFVIKSGEKVVEYEGNEVAKAQNPTVIPNAKTVAHQFDLGDIDANSIKSIHVLKGAEATNEYGIKGKDGVIVILLHDFDSLPDKTKKLFDTK